MHKQENYIFQLEKIHGIGEEIVVIVYARSDFLTNSVRWVIKRVLTSADVGEESDCFEVFSHDVRQGAIP
jgi:hypothetical protein